MCTLTTVLSVRKNHHRSALQVPYVVNVFCCRSVILAERRQKGTLRFRQISACLLFEDCRRPGHQHINPQRGTHRKLVQLEVRVLATSSSASSRRKFTSVLESLATCLCRMPEWAGQSGSRRPTRHLPSWGTSGDRQTAIALLGS